MKIKPKSLGVHWCSKCGSNQPFVCDLRSSYVRCETCRTLFVYVMEEPQVAIKTETKP